MARALINVPAKAKRGDVIEIKALISHPMETGYRTGPDGALVPRDIINRFICTYNGEEIFSADLFPAIAANPFSPLPRLPWRADASLSDGSTTGTSTSGNSRNHGRMRRMLKGLALTAGFGGALGLCISLATAQSPPISERKSGFEFMSPESQATQQDDFSNPGMLWVAEGEALWNVKAGATGSSCAECHGDAAVSMKGVAARYPVYFAESGRPIDLQSRINVCRKTT